jgi:hypothetical protein
MSASREKIGVRGCTLFGYEGEADLGEGLVFSIVIYVSFIFFERHLYFLRTT